MNMKRKVRIFSLQALFESDVTGRSTEICLKNLLKANTKQKNTLKTAETLTNNVSQNRLYYKGFRTIFCKNNLFCCCIKIKIKV